MPNISNVVSKFRGSSYGMKPEKADHKVLNFPDVLPKTEEKKTFDSRKRPSYAGNYIEVNFLTILAS
ncbi:hypothetical protein Trydic_g7332 [Trypoxylus dichotomus]